MPSLKDDWETIQNEQVAARFDIASCISLLGYGALMRNFIIVDDYLRSDSAAIMDNPGLDNTASELIETSPVAISWVPDL